MLEKLEREDSRPRKDHPVSIVYTNYRGETATRQIIPQRIWYGSTEWHPEEQWLLDAIDVEKNALRAFAVKDIQAWF